MFNTIFLRQYKDSLHMQYDLHYFDPPVKHCHVELYFAQLAFL